MANIPQCGGCGCRQTFIDSGVPLAALGNVGDYYIDCDTAEVYQKSCDGWELQCQLPQADGCLCSVSDILDVNCDTPNDGDILAYDSGAGEWKCQEPEDTSLCLYAEDTVQRCTSDFVGWTTALSYVTPVLDAGDYISHYRFEWQQEKSDRPLEWEIRVDGAVLETGSIVGWADDNPYFVLSDFVRFNIAAGGGAHTIDIRFRRDPINDSGSYQVCVRDARVEVHGC